MKNSVLFIAGIMLWVGGLSQDKILSFGYTKNFVNKDSSNVAIAIDLNRVPGRSETSGTFFLVNTPFIGTPLDFYVKPTADVNLGSYTSSAANNIAIGAPLGLAYLIPEGLPGVFFAALEVSPEAVADKSLTQYLYYVSPGVFLNYSYTDPTNNNIVDFGIGARLAFGRRLQNIKTSAKNSYQKFMVPVGLSLSLWNVGGAFYRVKFSGVYKFNAILKDNKLINPQPDYHYGLLKLDFYLLQQLGLNVTYNAGYEEPLFKKVNAVSFGISLAR